MEDSFKPDAPTDSFKPDEPSTGDGAGFWQSLTRALPHPIDALQSWLGQHGKTGELAKTGNALHVLNQVHAEAANDPANKGIPVSKWKIRPLTPEEQAAVDSGMSAKVSSPATDTSSGMMAPALTAGKQASEGNLAGAAGTIAGGYAAPAAVGAAAGPIARGVTTGLRKAPGVLMKSALKPGVADAPTLADARTMVDTAVEQGIPVSEKGVSKLQGMISDYGQKIRALVDQGTQRGQTIEPGAVAARIDRDLVPKLEMQVNPEKDVSAAYKSQQEFLDKNTLPEPKAPLPADDLSIRSFQRETPRLRPEPIPVDVAHALKTGTYQQLRAKYGEMGSATVEAQKTLARGLNEELQSKIDGYGSLNAEEGKLLDLQPALERAVRRLGNADLVKLGDEAMAAGGAAAGGPVGGVSGFILNKILSSGNVKSKMAIAINKASKKTAKPLDMAASMARAGAIIDILSGPSQQQPAQ